MLKLPISFAILSTLSLAATITCYYTNTGMVEALGQVWSIVVIVVPAVLFAILASLPIIAEFIANSRYNRLGDVIEVEFKFEYTANDALDKITMSINEVKIEIGTYFSWYYDYTVPDVHYDKCGIARLCAQKIVTSGTLVSQVQTKIETLLNLVDGPTVPMLSQDNDYVQLDVRHIGDKIGSATIAIGRVVEKSNML